jgi:anti-sigma regulatory factor (Ser/Thr protein kinase)
MKDLTHFRVAEASAAAEAKRRTIATARDLGFDDAGLGSVGIVVMELATNLYRHGGGGELLVRSVSCGAVPGMELVALDQGSGLHDTSTALRDGFSTAGGLGTGLGAVRRFSSPFDLYAPPGRGAAVFSRLWARPLRGVLPGRRFTVGAVSVPVAGESVCGDSWAVHQVGDRALIMVVDGLGHGVLAAQASDEAVATFRRHTDDAPLALVEALDRALQRTRGAAVAIGEALPGAGVLNYAGLGNISARLITPDGSSQLVSDDGIAGARTKRAHLRPSEYPAGALLVLHSDGVSARWKPDDYVGLWGHHPVLVAAVLYRDHRRSGDDATVLVAARKEPRA